MGSVRRPENPTEAREARYRVVLHERLAVPNRDVVVAQSRQQVIQPGLPRGVERRGGLIQKGLVRPCFEHKSRKRQPLLLPLRRGGNTCELLPDARCEIRAAAAAVLPWIICTKMRWPRFGADALATDRRK